MLADEDRLEKLRLAVELKFKTKTMPVNEVAKIVAEFYGISLDEIMSRDRPRDIYWARAVCYYLMRKNGDLSLRKIASRMGGKCSSKVHYSLKQVANRIAKEPEISKDIAYLENQIRGKS